MAVEFHFLAKFHYKKLREVQKVLRDLKIKAFVRYKYEI